MHNIKIYFSFSKIVFHKTPIPIFLLLCVKTGVESTILKNLNFLCLQKYLCYIVCEYLNLQSVLCVKSVVYCVMSGYGDINIQEIKLQTCID